MIGSIGNFQNILSTGNAREWLQNSRLEVNESKALKDINPEKRIQDEQTFGEFLTKSLAEVNKLQQNADTAMEKLATGKSQNIHETMIMIEEAEIAFKTMNQVRQKVLDAYKEIMKMQI